MSGPPVFEPDWPRHAKQADYEKFSRRELLDIEQLASLAAGFMFRTWRGASALNEDPTRKVKLKGRSRTSKWRKRPRPYTGAVNWGVLLRPDGVVGSFMTRWLIKHPDVYVAAPRDWVDFCKRERLPVHPEFRSHFRPSARRLSAQETKKETANRAKETLYRTCTLEILSALDRCRGIRLIQRQLWKLVVNRIKVKSRGHGKAPQFDRFKQLLRKWRRDRDDLLARKMARVLQTQRGPLRDDKKNLVESRLRKQAPELAAVLFPNSRSSLRV